MRKQDWRGSFPDRLLPSISFCSRIGHGCILNGTARAPKNWIRDDITDGRRVRGRDDSHASRRRRYHGVHFPFSHDLIDDNGRRRMVPDGFHNRIVMRSSRRHTHPPAEVPEDVGGGIVSTNLSRRIDDNHTLLESIRAVFRDGPEKRRLPEPGGLGYRVPYTLYPTIPSNYTSKNDIS